VGILAAASLGSACKHEISLERTALPLRHLLLRHHGIHNTGYLHASATPPTAAFANFGRAYAR
jgi:hypothetical protein